ncbi:MAG: MFS transporter [Granulosicoccus sp.]|nr:MFS transporter [Granulosicoccus sp.]
MRAVREYLAFIQAHPRFLLFGFAVAFSSSAGQTYFIGIFGPSIRETFELTHTQWGTIYMVGTLMSAAVLPWSGDLLDRFNLKWYSPAVLVGLVIACLSISLTPSMLFLVPAIFLLRQFGQGLSGHTSITSMARYMRKDRGKAIAIASMGFSCGEAILPFLAVLMIAAIGWRSTYQVTAFVWLCFIPLVLWLLRGHDVRHANHLVELDEDEKNRDQAIVSLSRRQMLREMRFYLLLPAVLAPSYISTALFFHHLTLAEAKGWSGIWVTGNYWVYAIFAMAASLGSGPLIDRFSAARVIPFFLTPMILGLGILIVVAEPIWVVPYLALVGINTGLYFTTFSALWAELYGTRFLGGIKSLIGALGVFASALGPVSIGLLLDLGYSIEQVFGFFAVFCVVSTVMLIAGLKRY